MAVTLPGMPRNQRVVFALGGELWAFMAALLRGDFIASPGILSTFQQHYNDYRGSLADVVREAGASPDALLPAAVRVSGQWDATTRRAAAAVLYMLHPQWRARLEGLPAAAGALGDWFYSTLASDMPDDGTNQIWDSVRVTEREGVNAASAINSWAFGVIESFAPDTSAPRGGGFDPAVFTSMLGVSAGSRVTQLIQQMRVGDAAASRGSNADNPGSGFVPTGTGETFEQPGLMIGGERGAPDRPAWGYVVAGVGVLGLAGLLVWMIRRQA